MSAITCGCAVDRSCRVLDLAAGPVTSNCASTHEWRAKNEEKNETKPPVIINGVPGPDGRPIRTSTVFERKTLRPINYTLFIKYLIKM